MAGKPAADYPSGVHDWLTLLREQLAGRCDPWLVLEGQSMVEAALAGWWEVAGVMVADDHPWEIPVWSGMEVARASPREMAALADPSRHHGVLGLAKVPGETGEVAAFLRAMEPETLLVVCPRLRTPELAGVAIRLGAEYGVGGVLFGVEGASPFHPDAVHAAGAALFQLPVRVADGGQLLRSLKAAQVELHGWENHQSVGGTAANRGRRAIVMGDPEHGLGPFWKAACDRRVGGEIAELLGRFAKES